MKTVCSQCGASLNLLPGVLAVRCLHCGHVHVEDGAAGLDRPPPPSRDGTAHDNSHTQSRRGESDGSAQGSPSAGSAPKSVSAAGLGTPPRPHARLTLTGSIGAILHAAFGMFAGKPG